MAVLELIGIIVAGAIFGLALNGAMLIVQDKQRAFDMRREIENRRYKKH